MSVLPGTHLHLSQVKHVRVKCLAQGHNIEIMSQYWERRNTIFFRKSCIKRDSKLHGKQWHWKSIIYTAVVDILVDFKTILVSWIVLLDEFNLLIVTSYIWCSGVKRVYFLVTVLKCKAYMSRNNKKKHEIYVAVGGGGGGCSEFPFFGNSPRLNLKRQT